MDISLVGQEGSHSSGQFSHTMIMTATDIATGWTVVRSIVNKAAKWVIAALEHVTSVFQFPFIGIDSDRVPNSLTSICLGIAVNEKIRSRAPVPATVSMAPMSDKRTNWTHVRELVDYQRYDTDTGLEKLNQIWELDRGFINYALP